MAIKLWRADVRSTLDDGRSHVWCGDIEAADRGRANALAVQAAAHDAYPYRLKGWRVTLKEVKRGVARIVRGN